MTVRFAHTNVRVKDPVASINFYRLLGLNIVGSLVMSEHYYLLYLAAEDDAQTPIELTINETGGPEYDRSPGSGHFALAVGNLDDCVTRLKEGGVSPLPLPFHPGDRADIRVAFVTDPDGHKIELVEGTFPTPQDPLPPKLRAALRK
jgi:lactoylglutathione lyase